MGKAAQISAWLAVVVLAFALQACGDDKQDQLTLLGNGGCRTADGGDGHPKYVAGLTLDACKAQCLQANSSCTAIEYNSAKNNCEIHSQPITQVAATDGVSCYVVK
jgi:PAN domain